MMELKMLSEKRKISRLAIKLNAGSRKTGKTQNAKLLVFTFSFAFYVLSFTLNCYAKEITILYTGQTHAMLYPCNCPKEPDGGVARRAALIKQLRKKYPNCLLLDSGDFSAGGLLDQYTQDKQLDMQRTAINLQAMELMKYDALAIGDDEFNFGKDFLQEHINKTKLTFLSCNAKIDKVLPYIVKKIANTKIGIIGVTGLLAAQKTEAPQPTDYKVAVTGAIAELKKEGANIIIVLSNLNPDEDLKLVNEVKGIDILISGNNSTQTKADNKVNDTLILKPSWQGRSLDRLTFTVKDNKAARYKTETLRLSDKITDDSEILSILPRCFSDANCKKQNPTGTCQNPGTLSSSCLFEEFNKVSLLIISPKDCLTCMPEGFADVLKQQFPGLTTSYLYYPDKKADKLIKEFSITGLPVYLLGKEAEREKSFANLKNNLELKGDFYVVKPQYSGISYFLGRNKIKGKLDLFISLHDKDTKELLDVVKEFNPTVHFLVVEQEGKFSAPHGSLEVEEDLRAVCVQKYYPASFAEYISCRAAHNNSSWWEDCLANLDVAKIKTCAKGNEGNALLKENISLTKELQIMFGPTYLLDNQEVFATKGVSAKDELRKIIKR